MKEIILASKSPYRKELLERLGIEFTCVNSSYDESILKKTIINPEDLTQKLATGKAKKVQENHKSSIIIGSDQVCYHDSMILGKTGSIEKSFHQLKSMQGSEHLLVTSYCILFEDKEIIRTVTTKLEMRSLTDLQINNYLRQDNPIDCAGSYKLELNGISLMKNIQTTDYTAIIGLPLIHLANDLIDIGVSIPPSK
jgi:septum formation protein